MTPSEWLLAEFDERWGLTQQKGRGWHRQAPGPSVARPMFDFLPAVWGGKAWHWCAGVDQPYEVVST